MNLLHHGVAEEISRDGQAEPGIIVGLRLEDR
jgi:hypothetical protein